MLENLKKKYFSAPLKTRLMVLVIILGTFLTFLTTSIQGYIYYSNQMNDLKDNINLILKSNKDSLEKSVWNLDTEQLHSVLNGILSYPNIHYINFTSKELKPIVLGEKNPNDWKIEEKISLYKNEIYLGEISVYTDLEKSLFNYLFNKGILILLTQIVQYALIISLILYVVNKLILKPITYLENYTHKISGNFEVYTEDISQNSTTPIELLHLGNTISKLKNSLFQHIESLRKYQGNLEELVHERTRQLNQAVTKAEKANNSKSQFLSNVTHELKTPLNAIITLSKILSKNNSQNLDEKDIKKVKIINHAGYELLDLVNELLDLSKIEAGELNFNFKKFNLSDLITDVYDLLQPTAEMKQISLINQNLPNASLTSDPFRISQIIKNIISNAIKFTDEGSVSMKLEVLENQEYNYLFTVVDTGVGIKESDLSQIFDRYTQLHSNTLDITPGSGLGLCISKMLSDKLICEIKVESTYGEGSRFSFYIKDLYDYVEIGSKKSYISEDLLLLNKKRVVLVDDDENSLYLTKQILEQKGAITTDFLSAKSLVNNLPSLDKTDIYIIDYKMPEMNGTKLANNIAGHPSYNGASIFILTKSSKDNFIRIAKRSKVSFVLSKPLNVNELVNAYRKNIT